MIQHLVLTATERLAQKRLSEQSPMAPTTISSLRRWVDELYQYLLCADSTVPRPLPAVVKEEWLREAIAQRPNEFVEMEATVRAILQADAHRRQWCISLSDERFQSTPDSQFYASLMTAYDERLMHEKFSDPEDKLTRLAQSLDTVRPLLPESLTCVGFDDLPPNLAQFLTALGEQGIAIHHEALPERTAKVSRTAFTNKLEEYRAIAKWSQESSPDEIAIVIPTLNSDRPLVEDVFWRAYDPEVWLRIGEKPRRPFNLSGGTPLSLEPVVHDALLYVRLSLKSKPTPAAWMAWLQSPFFFSDTARLDRTLAWQKDLSACLQLQLTVEELIALRSSEEAGCLPALAALQAWQRTLNQERTLDKWALHLWQHLASQGWPGERVVDSVEYQALMQWKGLLEGEFLTLAPFFGEVSFEKFQGLLLRLTRDAVFQMKSQSVNVNVLGLLEAGGIEAKRIWVAGLHHMAWPPAPKPNPFLPHEMQVSLNMPHASPEREWQFCQRLLNRLQHQCDELWLSYPQSENEEVFVASPMIQSYSETPWRVESSGAVRQCPLMESISDRIASQADGEVPGGISLINTYARCPFKALSSTRWRLRPPTQATPWLTPSERGILLHALLASLWGWIRTSDRLAKTSDAAISKHLTCYLESYHRRHHFSTRLPQSLWPLEQERFIKLILRWVQLERQRAPFSVEWIEDKRTLSIEGLQFAGRVDRIDRLASGETLIIDYKSGRMTPSDCFVENQAQLYAYQMTESTPAGIAFAVLNPKVCEWIGLSAEEIGVPGVKALEQDWAGHKQVSEAAIIEWVKRMKAGEYPVQPRYQEDCQYCDYGGLCRVKETEDVR